VPVPPNGANPFLVFSRYERASLIMTRIHGLRRTGRAEIRRWRRSRREDEPV